MAVDAACSKPPDPEGDSASRPPSSSSESAQAEVTAGREMVARAVSSPPLIPFYRKRATRMARADGDVGDMTASCRTSRSCRWGPRRAFFFAASMSVACLYVRVI